MSDGIIASFGELSSRDELTVRGGGWWVVMELNSSLLWGSGDAVPSGMALKEESGEQTNMIGAAGFDPAEAQTRTYVCGANNNCNDRD
ncbi:hypothetical protein B1218_38250, partial [Pseudomonas ogarae]